MSILGNRVLRKEDPRFLRGRGPLHREHGARGCALGHVRALAPRARAHQRRRHLRGGGVAERAGLHRCRRRRRRPRARRRSRSSSSGCGDRWSRRTSFASSATSSRSSLSEDRATGEDAAELVVGRLRPAAGRRRQVEARRRTRCCSSPKSATNVAGRAGRMDHDQELFAGCDVVVSDTIVRPAHGGLLRSRSGSAAAEVGRDGRTYRLALDPGAAPRHHGPRSRRSGSSRASSASSPRTSAAASERRAPSAPRRCSSSGSRRQLGQPVRWTETRTREHDRAACTDARSGSR